MVLQNVIFPCDFALDAPGLYFRCGDGSFFENGKIVFEKGAECRFDTYTASFSVGKWSKYADFDGIKLTLRAEGRFTACVFHTVSSGNGVIEKKVAETVFSGEGIIVLPVASEGIYYFTLKAETDGAFFGGDFSTDSPVKREVNMRAVVCTYRREKFVESNMNLLKRDIFDNTDSPLRGKLKVFVVDNGSTIPEQNGDVTVIHNKNTGGAGGFTRGLIETMKVREKEGITHIVLTDDDVRFESESFFRTFTLLSYLKEEYEDAFIGGAMFRTDEKYVQNERADRWDYARGKVVPIGSRMDMSDATLLPRNEEEEEINYLSWWFCAIPASVPSETNLPLPIFIKRDDIEYGLRNGKKFITLNGIFVWHEPFEAKRPAFLEYYYNRNQCIMESVHKTDFTAKTLKKRVIKETARSILTFRYNEAESALKGVNDFLKGTDFLRTTDPTELNASLMNYNAASEKADPPTDYKETYRASCRMSAAKKIAAILTLNGWLLPWGKRVTVPSARPSWKAFFGAKSALNVNPSGTDGFVTRRSYKKAFSCVKKCVSVLKNVNAGFDKAKTDYRENFGEITSLGFWNEYLGLTNGQAFAKTGGERSRADGVKVSALKTAVREVKLLVHKTARVAFRMLSAFIPLSKDKVVFVATKRKGFACNPKYVALALKEKYGDKFRMIWVSDYPETCGEVSEQGIKVVGMNTLAYVFAQLGAKTVVYNDSIPSYMPKRKNQIYVNTWHGAINYKHIGYDYLQDRSKSALKKFAMRNPQPDYFISGSGFFTKDTATSFRFSEDAFLGWGLPRNSLLFDEEKKAKAAEKVRAYYGVTDKKILIYAPTFRNGFASDAHGLDFAAVAGALEKRFGGEWTIFYRGHGFVEGKADTGNNVTDVTEYPDMQEIIAASDAMISDYSSAMWDMIFTGKPIFVYAPDMVNYDEHERSFAYPVCKWPYPIAETNEEIVDKILGFDENAFDSAIKKHLEEAGSFENGKAAEKTAALIAEISFGGEI